MICGDDEFDFDKISTNDVHVEHDQLLGDKNITEPIIGEYKIYILHTKVSF